MPFKIPSLDSLLARAKWPERQPASGLPFPLAPRGHLWLSLGARLALSPCLRIQEQEPPLSQGTCIHLHHRCVLNLNATPSQTPYKGTFLCMVPHFGHSITAIYFSSLNKYVYASLCFWPRLRRFLSTCWRRGD